MKSVLSIFLAFHVLLSSLSFNIGMHFCGEKLQSFSLFQKATPCEHAQDSTEKQACPFHAKKQDKKKGCCEDEQVVIEGQEHPTTVSSYSADLSSAFGFTLPLPFLLVENWMSEARSPRKFLNYKPPLIRIDIPVLIQTFLI